MRSACALKYDIHIKIDSIVVITVPTKGWAKKPNNGSGIYP